MCLFPYFPTKKNAFISYINEDNENENVENKNGTTKIDSSFLNMPAQSPIKGPIPKINVPAPFSRDIKN